LLKIRRYEDQGLVAFILSGRIEEKDVADLQKLIEGQAEPSNITFDLEEVRLVDRESVRFLAACEARGIKLKNCPSYIRQWIETGRDTSHEG
jgi:hypothetical protein